MDKIIKVKGEKMKKHIYALLFVSLAATLYAQEALKSTEEEYYDFLYLLGKVERPTLNYRTLSDNEWNLTEGTEHLWQNNNLGKTFNLYSQNIENKNWFLNGLNLGLKAKIYGPQWFNSYNTASPYGQNDGALWQGKGYNTALTGGLRLEGYGFELTFKPQITFSQNLEFTLLPSAYDSEYAYFWGYGNNKGIDAPQRFGNTPYWQYDWGDSEIRWTWHSFTTGFGTQSIWLGPVELNPLLHSNNAPTYPKFDIGIRKTELIVPNTNISLGTIEGRMWLGYLTESDYFDNDDTNNHNQITTFSISYEPPYLSGLVFGINKVCLSKWDSDFWKYLNPFYDDNYVGSDASKGEDQKISVTVDYFNKKANLELYTELGLDDYLQGGWIIGLLRYPMDSLMWTFGLKQMHSYTDKIKGELVLEVSNMELPSNKIAAKASYSYNMHYQISQGYTNRGQVIGTALANGGNSQYLKYKLYYPKGCSELFFQRTNPDNTYSYLNLSNENQTYKSNFYVGISNTHYVLQDLYLNFGFVYNLIINPYYWDTSEDGSVIQTGYINNFHFSLGAKYTF